MLNFFYKVILIHWCLCECLLFHLLKSNLIFQQKNIRDQEFVLASKQQSWQKYRIRCKEMFFRSHEITVVQEFCFNEPHRSFHVFWLIRPPPLTLYVIWALENVHESVLICHRTVLLGDVMTVTHQWVAHTSGVTIYIRENIEKTAEMVKSRCKTNKQLRPMFLWTDSDRKEWQSQSVLSKGLGDVNTHGFLNVK